jgi:hypothetical protein
MTLAGAVLGLLVSINIFTISDLLSKLDIIPFIFPSQTIYLIVHIAIILLFVFYYQGKRGKNIIEKYVHWKKKDKIKGTWFTILYIIATYGALFGIGAFFKPINLPTISF